MAVKYVFVTGGVVSGLGKGITAASLGRLLKARGYQVTMQKFDHYINIDPGTMNPIQHGEVFVTDDGTETDLDLGHYERFIDESLDKNILYCHLRFPPPFCVPQQKGVRNRFQGVRIPLWYPFLTPFCCGTQNGGGNRIWQ